MITEKEVVTALGDALAQMRLDGHNVDEPLFKQLCATHAQAVAEGVERDNRLRFIIRMDKATVQETIADAVQKFIGKRVIDEPVQTSTTAIHVNGIDTPKLEAALKNLANDDTARVYPFAK